MDYGITSLIRESTDSMLLYCGSNFFPLHLGELTYRLCRIPTSLLDHVIDCASSLQQNSTASKSSIVVGTFNPYKTKKALKGLANEIYACSNDGFYVAILLDFPLSMYLTCSSFSGYKLNTKDSIYRALRRKNRIFGEVIDNLKKKYGFIDPDTIIDEKAFYTELWSYFLQDEQYDEVSYYDGKIIDGCITHLERICQNAKALRELQPKLSALEQRRFSERLNINNLPEWLLPGINDVREGSSFVSILGCILLEQLIISESNLFIKQCALCGKVFTTSDIKARYCSNPNPAYSLRSCKAVMRSKNSKKSLALFPQYNQARKSYSKWKKENIDAIKGSVPNDALAKQMIEEIESIYRKWSSKAEKALYDHNSGFLNEQQALKAIEMPSIENRGPKAFHYFQYKN